MIKSQWKGYAGVQEDGFIGYQASNTAFCFIEIFDAKISKQEGQKIVNGIVASLEEERPGSLASVEELINRKLKENNLPLDFSMALGYRVESVLYLKTVGSGSIILKRDGHFKVVIEGDNTASGYLKEGDAVIFSTDYFFKQMKGEEHLRKVMHSRTFLADIEERMKNFYEGSTEGGGFLIAVFSSPAPEPDELTYAVPNVPDEGMRTAPERTFQRQVNVPDVASIFARLDRKKIIGAVVIAGIFLALVLNIRGLFGAKQQTKEISRLQELSAKVKERVESDDYGDIQQTLGEITELRKNIQEAGKTDKKASQNELSALLKDLDAYESKVLKKETKTGVEFYDLSLEEKNAQGSRISLEEEMAYIINKQGRIYRLSLENKSVKKYAFPEIVNADLVGSYDGNVYSYKQGAGVYKIDTKDTIKRVIANDTDWAGIADMQIYNGNIYLLDPGNGNIYKYLVAEGGFSEKIPYFQSEIPSLKQSKCFSINIAIYIGLRDSILKYLTGNLQDFDPLFPDPDITLSKIFTSSAAEDVYGLDKAKGILYVWDKDGAYLKQVQSPSFVKADDFVIYKNSAFVLKGSKIFRVEI